jgi:hypothetical protein
MWQSAVLPTLQISEQAASILKLKVSTKKKCFDKPTIGWSKTKEVMNTNMRTPHLRA